MAIKLHHLRPAPGSKTAKTRVGRGEGGKGKSAGRGTKGSKARTNIPAAFPLALVLLLSSEPHAVTVIAITPAVAAASHLRDMWNFSFCRIIDRQARGAPPAVCYGLVAEM